MLLKDRVAIITGGGSGIGQGVAERFAREGAKLMLVDLNPAGLAETAKRAGDAGAEVETFAADVSQTAQVEAFFAKTVERFGRINICVNNAGIGNPPAPIVQMTDEGFDRTIAVNLRGVFLCMRAAGRQMMAQSTGGRIISVASQAGKTGFAFLGPYCATKAGVILMTKAMAKEVGGVTLPQVVQRTGMTFPTATKGMTALAGLGIAKEFTAQRRNRIFAYDPYLAILTEGTEPL
jgi:meso-butanediol dehydrogenase/(S,S)-butanediol dehydrogenase/diacetyl reductase